MAEGGPTRLAEVLGALSLATDLVDGFPYEKAIRHTVVGQRIGRAMGLSVDTLADAYYGSIVRNIGCTAFASEEGALGGGDDIGLRTLMAVVDEAQPVDALRRITTGLGAHQRLDRRLRTVAGFLADRSAAERHHLAQCDAGVQLGRLLALPDGVVEVLDQAFERYDGRGKPAGVGGDDLALPTRLVHVADIAELFHQRYGTERMSEELRQRAGHHLDPLIVAAALELGPGLVVGLEGSCWDEFLDVEPGAPARISPAGLDRTALAFARFVDLKSTWTLGHSERVADLAGRAGEAAGLPADRCRLLGLAGLLHDLGRCGVPSGIWDKPGPLNAAEWERVESHSYHTERILRTSPLLEELAAVAGATHERPNGRGYHKRLPAGMLSQEARLLAAADAYVALGEDRAHRRARPPEEAASVISADAGAGRFDPVAVRCVLQAAGEAGTTLRRAIVEWPVGLTDAEIRVLRLVARGASTKETAAALGITTKTVGHHIEHIYDKIGSRSRAGAALFAVEHGIVGG